MAAIQCSQGYALEWASDDLRADRQIVLTAVKLDGNALEFAADALRADRETFMAAVAADEGALEFASDDLRADRQIVLAAVATSGYVLPFASDDLRADREIVLAAVATSRFALPAASDDLRADREIVMAAVATSGLALEHASDDLRADREIVMAAVQSNKYALRYASNDLRADRDFVLKAMDEFRPSDEPVPWLDSCIDGKLFSDREFVLEAIPKVGRFNGFMRNIDAELRDDYEVISKAIQRNAASIRFASDRLRRNRQLVLEAVRKDGGALGYLTEHQIDREIVLAAIQNNPTAYRYASETLKSDPYVSARVISSSSFEGIHVNFHLIEEGVKDQLKRVVNGLKQRENWYGPMDLCRFPGASGTSVLFRHRSLERIWLVKEVSRDAGLADFPNLILVYLDVKEDWQFNKEFSRLAPIFTAFAVHEINWNGMFAS